MIFTHRLQVHVLPEVCQDVLRSFFVLTELNPKVIHKVEITVRVVVEKLVACLPSFTSVTVSATIYSPIFLEKNNILTFLRISMIHGPSRKVQSHATDTGERPDEMGETINRILTGLMPFLLVELDELFNLLLVFE